MQILDKDTKFAHLGKPGGAFTPGFARRFAKLSRYVDLTDKRILDIGCGEGVWLSRFAQVAGKQNVFGSEYDPELIAEMDPVEIGVDLDHVRNCAAEKLAFDDASFDIVFSHEVLEHVQDDKQAVLEALRVLKPGGKMIVFTPNRGWPFEQHGMFWRGKYYWGNIPLLPWLPFLQKALAPHVRNYSYWHVRSLFPTSQSRIVRHDFVFPAFDRLAIKYGFVGKLVQKTFYLLERTPLRVFGISHFLIVEKI